MTRLFFQCVALITLGALTSPAWAAWASIEAMLPENIPQPSTLVVLLLGVAGLVVGRYASRKKRD